MSDTNPKHTPMSDVEFEQYAYYGTESDPSVAFLCAEARRARDSEAALKARCAELEQTQKAASALVSKLDALAQEHFDRERAEFASDWGAVAFFANELRRALLSPRDGEAEPEYCAHCNRIDVPGYHQSDCPAADDGEAK